MGGGGGPGGGVQGLNSNSLPGGPGSFGMSDPWSSIGGSGSDPGFLGTGQYRSDMYNADANAFNPDSNENSYISMLQQRANGQSPSVAEMQMQQGLNQSTQQAQALAASQRGINPALAARMGAQSQAQMLQQNNAQTGMLRANEQQNSMGQLGDELRSVRTGRENFQSLNSGNYNQNNALNQRGYADAAAQRGNLAGGMMNQFGGGMVMSALAKGGEVKPIPYASGGDVFALPTPIALGGGDPTSTMMSGKSSGGKKPSGGASDEGDGSMDGMDMAGGAGDAGGIGDAGVMFAADGGVAQDNFEMPGQVGGGGGDPAASNYTGSSGKSGGGGASGLMGLMALLAKGGGVPGRASVKGNSYANDKVPAVLSPGEIVLPRSVTTAKNAPELAKEFVQHIQKQKNKSADGPSYAEVLKMHRELGAHIKALAKKNG